ncbi:neuroblast differentiation-associated protein AHNAK isoform X2 [Heterodontus francisci]|uniref:neuroblast differentiation-associated protein AHNAK isoform X2 n=1 Tax=Heterodontus francisci TaxID=7792 RepID=UPI00355C62E4
MAKKEDDLDVLLPNWEGAAAHGFSISGSDDGIFIKDVVQNSPAGKSGVMKEGDQIVSATIYFDDMGYEEAQKILRTVDRHTVGLKLHRKGEKLSPGGNYSWNPERLEATSPDAVLSGDDEDYQRIYRTKIKPRLKSEDDTEASGQSDRSSNVHITRKVITRTIHTSGPTVITDMDNQNPEFKIKVPRYEQVTIERSGPKLETSEMDVDVNLSSTECGKFQMGDGQRTTHTMHIVKTKVVEVPGPDTEHGQTTFHMSQINVSGGTTQTSDLDVKIAKASVDISAPKVDLIGPNVKFPNASIDVSVPKVTTDKQMPVIDITTTKPDVEIGGSDGKMKMPSVKMPELSISGSKVRDPVVDINTSVAKTVISSPKIDDQRSKMQVNGSGFSTYDGKLNIKMKTSNFSISGSDPKEILQAQAMTKEVPDVNISTNFPEADVKLSRPKIESSVEIPGVNLDVEGGAGEIKGPRFKMPGISISGPKIIKPDTDLQLKGPRVAGDGDTPDSNLQGGIKGPDFNITDTKFDIEGHDVKESGVKFSVPSIKMPNRKTSDIDLSLEGPKLKGDHDIHLPSANIAGKVKRPNIDVDMPKADIEGARGKLHVPKFKVPQFQMSGPKVESPDLNIDAYLPEADAKLTGPKIGGGVDLPDVDLDVERGSGKIKGPKFKMPENISGPKFKKPDFNIEIKGPKMGGDVDVPDVNLEGDFKGPDMNIEGPKVDIGGPDVKGRGLKFSLPAMNMPNIKAPDLDFKLKGPKLKGDHDIELPSANIEGEVKSRKVDVDVPEADIKGPSGKIHMPKFRMPTFGMGGPKVEGPDLNIDANLPEADVNLTGPKIEGGVDLPDVDLDVEGGHGKIKGPKFKMPELNISGHKFKQPDFDVQLKGPKMGGDINVPDVNLEGDFKGPDMNIEGPEVDIGGPDVKGRGLKFSLPTINMPNIKAPDLDFKLKGPKLKGDHDIELPSANIEGEVKGPKVDVDVDVPQADIKGPSGKFHMPKFTMPTFGMGGPKVESPDLNIDANLPEADVNLTGPKIEGGVDLPDVDLDVEGGPGKIKGPKFKMPELNISGHKFKQPDFDVQLKGPKMGGDINVPDVNLEGDFKGPDMNIEGPEVDIGGPDVKGRGLKFSLPAINMPNIKAPDLDFKLKGPKLKGDHDIDLPSDNIEGEVKGPKVDVDVPEADIKGPSGKFHMPKFRMPTFGMGGPKVEGPDLNFDANLPEADVNLTGPKIEGGVDLPDLDLDVEGGPGKIKGPKFKMPELNISGHKFKQPDFDVQLKGPKMGGDVDVPDVNLEGDFKGPDMNIEGPEVDIGGPDVKGRGLKFSLPAINMPNIKAPDLDFKLKGPKLKGDHDIELPSANIEGEVKGPKVDVDVDVPQADIKGSSGKFHMPKFRMPTFGMGGPKVEGPDLNIDANLPEADVNLTGPKIEGGVDLPDIDLDVEGGPGKIKGPKFKMPEFNISGHKFKTPDFDVQLKGPKMGGDVNVPDVKLEGDFKGPDMNIEGPKVDLGGPDVKGRGLKFSLPAINMPNIKAPDLDFKLKGPKLKGDHDIDLPSANIEGEVKGPKVDVDVDVPEADIKGPSGKFHMPKFRMPTFGMGGPKVEGPDLNIDANLPEADLNLTGPKIEGGVDLPDVDLDVEGGPGKIKGPKFKMPEFNISGHKFKTPDFDGEIKGPKMGGDVNVPDVNLEGDFKGADMNIEGPKVDIGGPDVKGRGLKFSLPTINMPNIKAPDLDFKLKGPKVEGDHDIDLPSASIEGEVKGPKVDVDVDVPEADIKGPSGKFHMPKFRMPTFGMGGPKVEGPDLNIDANLPEADVNLTGPKIEGGVDLPEVDLDVERGSGKIKGPKFKMPEFNLSGHKFKKPDFNVEIKGPKMGGDVDVPDVNLEGDFKGADMNIEGPKVDIGGPDVKGRGLKFSLPTINMPNIKAPDLDFKLKGPKLKGDHDIDLPSAKIEGEVKGPKVDVDVDVPEADIKGPSGKFHMPKFRMPTFGMGGPKVEGPDLNIDANLPEADVNLTGPKIEGGVDLPDVDLDVERGSGKIKGPKFKMPELNISGHKFKKPDFDVQLKGPKMGGDVNVPDVNLEGDFKGPDMNIEGPKVDIGGPDAKGRGLKFSLPTINMPNIKAPDLDFKLKGPKLKGDHDIDLPSANIEGEVKGPKVDVDVPEADIKGPSGKFHMPKFRMPTFGMGGPKVEGPDLNIDANLPEADVNLTGPKIEGGVDLPEVDLDVERGSGKIKGPKFKMPEFNLSGHKFKTPDFDVQLKGPKMGGDVDVPDVNLEGDFKGPDMNIEGPKVDIGGPDVKGRGLKFSLPAINMPNIKAPDLDFKLKGPKLKGDHEIDLPSANIEGEVKGPKVDVDVDVPEADIKGPSGKFHMPKFRMPTFGLGGPKVEGPDLNIDASLPEADVNLTEPKIEGGVDLPDVDLDVEGGPGKIKGPKFKMPELNISGHKFKKPDFNVEIKGPKMGGDVNIPDVNLEGDFKGPDMNIEGPKVDLGGPDVKGRGLKFSLPAINMPNIKAPDLDFKLKGPKLKGDHDIDLPSANIEGEVKGPKVDVDVDVPEADIKGPSGKFHMPKFRMPTFGLGGPKVEGPDLNIDANLPEADLNLTGPKIEGGVDLPEVDLDVERGSGKIKGPKFKMPEFNLSGHKFKTPDFDVQLKGPKMGGDVNVPDVNLEGDFKGPDMNIEGPKVDIGGPDVKGRGLKFSLPAINMPNIKAPDLDFKLKGPKLKGDHDIDLPSANIEGEVKGPKVDVDVDVPEADIKGPSGKFHMPKFRMPTFGLGGPKVEGPDLNIDASLPKADVNLTGPKIEGGVDLPDVDLDVEGGPGKIKGPKFKMPELNISGHKFKKPDFDVQLKGPKLGGDVNVPDVNLEGDFKGPDMNIEGPKVDIGGPDVKGRGLKFSLPAINMPNIKAPDLDFKLKGPKLKGDHDIDLPSANIEGEVKGPKVDVDVDVPEADIKGPSGKFHMPKFRMPTFGLGGPKVEGPDLNIDASLPEADVNLTGPKIEGGVDLPDVDLDVEGGPGKIKGPKFKMPELNISGHKFKKPDFNVEIKGPKMGGDVNIPDVNLEGDFKGPDMNIEGPKVDLGGPDVKGRGLKFSLPAINMPNIKAPDLDFKLKGPKLKGDHDIDLPSANIEGEVKGPKVDVDVDVPEADIKGPSGKFHMPKFRMPTFGMGGPKVEGPDLNIDANLPEADVNLTGPKIEGGVDLPDVDLDVERGSGKIKGPKFKMPEFNLSGHKFKTPDFDVQLKGPKMGGDVNVPDVNLEGDFKGPDMNIEGPKVDIGGPDVKGRGLKFSLPAINMPNIKAPDLDFKLKGPKLKGDHDIDLPSANIEGEVKGPKVDVDVDVPEADIKGPSGKFHMPKFRMPTFGMGGPKVEGPDLNIDANLPEADLNLTGPKIEGGVDLPDVDLDVEGGPGKIKGPKFKMPEFNLSGHKFKKPDFNVELKGPKMGGDFNVPDVNLGGDFKGPDLSIEGPKVDIGGPDVKGRSLKFSLPAINMPNIKAPNLDFKLKGPKLKGDHDIDLPSANIEGEVKGPKVDVDVPEADIKGPSGKFHMPKFRMPTFGIGGPKVEGPDLNIDANLPEADVSLTGPKIEGGVDLPDVDLDVEGGPGKIKGPKFKMPEFNLSGHKFKKPDFDVQLKGPKMGGDINVPDVNLEGDFKGPDLSIEGPEVDIEGPDVKGRGLKFSLPAINMPNIKAPDLDFKLKGPKLKGDHDIELPSANIEGEVKGPKVDVNVPEADIKGPSGKFHMPKFRMPTFGMGGPKVEGPDLNIDANLPEADVNLTGPKIEGGVDLPDVDLDVEGGHGKIKGPKFKMPEFNLSGHKFKTPDFDVQLKGPKMGGDVNVPDVNLEGDFKGPDMNIEGPKVDIGGPDVKGRGLKFSLPAINMPNIKAPDLDFKLKGPKLKGDHDIDLPSANIEGEVKGPKVDVDVDVPEADIKGPSGKFHMPKFRMPTFGMGGPKVEGPDLNIDANLPEADLNLTGPKIEGGVDLPDVDLDVEGGPGKIKGPKFKMPEFNLSGHKFKKPDFDVQLKGPKMGGDVNVPDVNLEGDFKGLDMNIEGPEVDIGGPDVKGRGLKFSLPTINMPNIKAPDLDFKLKGPKLKGDHDIDLPSANIEGEVKGPKVDVDVPEADIKGPSGKFHMPKFRMPTFGMGGPKVEGPDLNIDANLPEADLNLTGPKIEGGVDLPDIDLDVEGGPGKIKGPKFKMPEFNISGHKFKNPDFDVQLKGPKMGGDFNVPDVNLEGDFKGPDMNIEGPKVDMEGPDVKGRGLKFSLPTINMPNIKAPDLDFKLKGPKLKGDHDIELPSANIEGEVKGPKVDVDVPEADIKGPSGKFHMPKFRMPTFGMGGPKVEGPDLNIDANLPEANLNLTGPKIEGGVDLPDLDLDVEGGPGKIKGPKFKMPEFNLSGHKFKKPDFDVQLKGPKMGGDFNVPDVNLEGDFKGPDMNIEGPEVDIGGPDVKGRGLKFSLPTINMPNIKAPDLDFKLKGPKLKGDHDIELPSANIEGEVKGPKVDVDVPEADIKGPSGKFHMPKFRMPTFGMGGPKVEGPDLNIDANLPEANLNLTGPKIEGGVDLPDVDLDVEGGPGKIKGPKFKMPEFNLSGHKFKKPDFDVQLKGPKMGGDVNVPDVNLEGDFKGPDMNIEGPEVDIGGPDVKGRGLKFSLPTINMPNIKAPDLDFKLKGPKLKGDHDIELPSANIEGEVKGPKVDVDVPEADIKGPSGKFHMPKFRMPTFGMGGPKVEGPDLNIDANLPEADLNLTGPKIEGGVDLPEVDLDVEGGPGKIKGPKFKMPEFNISGHKFKNPDFDVQLKGPKMGGDVNVPDVNLEGDFKGPDMNIEGPKVDMEGPDVKGRGLKFSLPAINMPNIKAPDLDFKLKGPKLKGDHDIDLPSANIEGEIKGPKVDVDVDVPEADIKGPGGKFHMPKFRMPTFGMGGPKVEGPDLNIDANLPEADVNLSGPKIKGGIEVPDIDVDADGKIKGHGFQMPGINVSLPKIKAPNFDLGFKSPEVTGGVDVADINMESDIKGPNFDIKGPKVDIKGPEMNIEGPDVKGNGHNFSLPSLDISGPNISSPDMNFDLKGPKVEGTADIQSPSFGIDVSAPDLDIDSPEAHLKMPKVKKPKFGFGIKGPQAEINAPSLDATGPDVDLTVDSPDLNISNKGKKGKFRMPKFNIKSKKPAGDVKVTAPKSDLDLSKPEVDIKSPDLNVSLGSSDGQLNIKSSKVKKPRFGKMKLSFPDVEFDLAPSKIKAELPSPKIEGDLQAPEMDVPSAGIKGPHVDIKSPGIDVNTNVDLEGSGFKAKGTKLKFPSVNIKSPKMSEPDLDINLKGTNLKGEVSGGVKGPTIDVKRPEIDFDVDAPNVDIEKPEGKLKMKMKKPKFTISGPKFKGSGVDIDVGPPKLESGIKGPEVNIDVPSIGLQPQVSAPDLHLKESSLKGDVCVSGPTMECDIKGPDVNLDTSNVNIAGVGEKLKMPKLKLPSFGVDHKAAGPDMDVAVNLPKADLSGPKVEGDINIPSADIKIGAPEVNIDGHDAKVKGSSLKMPSWKLSGPKISSPDFDLKGDIGAPKIDMKGPRLDLKTPDVNFEGPEGKLKMPEFNTSGTELNLGINAPKIGGNFKTPGLDVNLETSDVDINTDGKFKGPQIVMPSVDISAPKLDTDLKDPQLKGDVNISSPNIKGDFRGLDVAVKSPNIDVGAADIDFKGAEGKLKMPQINLPKAEIDISGQKMKGVSAPDFDINVKGPQLGGNLAADLSGPKIDTDIKCPKVDIKGPNVKMDTPDISFGGLKGKGPSIDFNVPKPNIGFSEPKFEGDMKGDINVSVPDVNLSAKVKSPEVKIPTANVKFDAKGPLIKGVDVSSPKGDLKGPEFDAKAPNISTDIKAAMADFDVPLDKLTIPKFKHSQFKTKGTNLEGPEMAMGVSVPEAQLSVSGAQGPNVNIKGPQASVSLPEGEMESSGVRIKKGKIKMPKFNFSKSKGKSSIEGAEGEFSVSGPKVDIKGSKGSLGFSDIEMEGAEMSASGKGSGLDISTSPKGKSGTLDFSLFKSKKSERHRSSSLSDEHELSPSSPKGRIEFGEGAAGAKGKKSKLKFGTFGGFGAKSKGSYEVTLGEGEAEVEGSGISLVSKKSRMSSSSSNESGSRAGFRLPKVELNINKNKE